MLPKSAAPEAVKVDMCGQAAVIRLCGDLDVTVIPVLSDKLASLAAGRPEHLVLDTSAASVVDRTVAAIIIHAARAALPPRAQAGHRLTSAAGAQDAGAGWPDRPLPLG